MRVKEVTLFTNGDPHKLSTWSNVPFFVLKTLEAKGIKVNCVDISPNYLLNFFHYQLFWKILKIFNSDTALDSSRNIIHIWYTKFIINAATKKYSTAQANIFLTFSFTSPKVKNQVSILLCDWTYEYYFKYFKKREPDFCERIAIRNESKMIEESDIVITLFSTVFSYMNTVNKPRILLYLGNVINSLISPNQSNILALKSTSQDILFIGNIKYIYGATILIESFKKLLLKFPKLSLHIVGMNSSDFKDLPDRVICHGYLNKGCESDKKLYYSLLEKAKVFINTTPKWGAISATIEAMYLFTPVIVEPYDEFVKSFGAKLSFGLYCESQSSEILAAKIEEIFSNKYYNNLCLSAHNSVKDCTWSSYIDKVLYAIETYNTAK
ncbi:glycosyltransferase [Spirosoma validum]|uniref:Glycosyltransferase n=1 Tax=Spirosoma validum TaxID=2771355 RepID=A0A927B0U8_9BACT|nr:glycosyltransferase [Spirosoma validum]MBD2753314.1 glycosyltransferase [Spirosoma validum]